MSYIEFNNVVKEYGSDENKIKALNCANFSIEKGELAVILGASGAGKTTALNILGGMDTSTSGNVIVDGKNIADFNNRKLCKYRREDVGFVFQFYNLVPNLTAIENVELAIARAIAKNPKLLLCDEPTGALDYKTGKQILQLLQDTCRKDNMTVIIITHNSAIASMADKVIHFKSGEVTNIEINPNPTPVEQIEW